MGKHALCSAGSGAISKRLGWGILILTVAGATYVRTVHHIPPEGALALAVAGAGLASIFWIFAIWHDNRLNSTLPVPSTLTFVSLCLGVLAFLGTALWCVGGAGMYGSPLAGISGKELVKVWAFLLVGPLSILPAAILAIHRPRWGGLWSIVGGLLSGYLIWFVIPDPNQRGGLHFEAIVPLVLVSAPMLGLGVWQTLAAET